MSGPGKVYPLQGSQRHAVEPEDSVWLSASAGTGKTQVLSARVLRLLLQPGVDPSQVLCLTFTKAGAAEMAVRINEVLASWVRLPDADLFKDLEAIGAPSGPEARAHARTLFASVLDCPGGGLRIDTIHAFSQWLLAVFPNEAGLSPGVRAMEDRDRDLLQRKVLGELLLDAEARGDQQLLDALASLSLRLEWLCWAIRGFGREKAALSGSSEFARLTCSFADRARTPESGPSVRRRKRRPRSRKPCGCVTGGPK